ncbi:MULTISPECIES: SPFH domain-containing protein [Acidiphilium]|jgi:regulator of protease activity HflC (stomatin/prohibitin superfamily)|uniref:SPFH domain-containing protein n=1 Tax=Acidiphilium TaxID=522 RepID=UPI001B8BA4CD|nr:MULTISPECIES: SPFH domain-containing protein [Acidiphilium]MBS3023972.1 slipin family protein [Acidiphilium multivorum]MBU6357058.1 slipin family protein [Rhodospirillales bacterium]
MNRSAATIAVILIVLGVLIAVPLRLAFPGAVVALLGIVCGLTLRTANEWERAVVLRLGRFAGIRGPGVFFIIPVIETVYVLVDTRKQSTIISAENTLTLDGVSVAVDSVLFWKVEDVRRVATELTDYRAMIGQVAQTSLREIISGMGLGEILGNREAMDAKIRAAIAAKSQDWGIGGIAVEIRDVRIPAELNDAMSRNAQAEKEKQARVTLASSEVAIAEQIVHAGEVYAANPMALKIRQMNLVYEMNKDRGATILLPTELAGAMSAVLKGLTPEG